MKYRMILAVIAIIALVVSAGLLYLNNVFLPIQLKIKITRELEKNLNKNVAIGNVRYSLVEGLIIKNISITDKGAQKPLLAVKKISFNPLLLPLLQKKIIIPVLHIDSPQISLTLKKDNTLNIMELLPRQKTGSTNFSVLISKLDLSGGICYFRDERFDYTREITDLKVGAGLNLPSHIKFLLQAKVASLTAGPSFISASGEYNLLTQNLQAKIKAENIVVGDYILYLSGLPFVISQGAINADLELNLKEKQLKLKGKATAANIRLNKDKFIFSGNIEAEPDIDYSLEGKSLAYKSRLAISKAFFSGIQAFGDITDIQGDIYLENNRVSLENLKGNLLKSPAELKGNLNLLENRLTWEGVSLIYKDNQYNSSGDMQDFKEPRIAFNIASRDLNAEASISVKDKLVKIETCKGKYLNSEFALKGNIDTAQADNPLAKLNLTLNFNLNDIINIIPQNISQPLKKMQAEGSYNINTDISGSINNLKALSAYAEISSRQTKIYGLKLDNIYFTLEQKNGLVNINDFTAGLYAGKARFRGSADIAGADPSYTATLLLDGVDLAQLKLDTKLKDSDLAGKLNLQSSLQGKIKELETLQGNGVANITEGKLWELNLFKGLGELFFTPIYKKTIFTEAKANFSIRDKQVYFTDAFLKGDGLNLQGAGKMGFDSSLDLILNTEINEGLIRESPDLRKFTSLIFGNLLAIKISGTLQKPEYKVVTPAKQFINQLKNLIIPKIIGE